MEDFLLQAIVTELDLGRVPGSPLYLSGCIAQICVCGPVCGQFPPGTSAPAAQRTL